MMALRSRIGVLRPVLASIQHQKPWSNRASLSENFDSLHYDSKYTKEQEAEIFKFLNTSEPEEILRLNMPKLRIKKILSRRDHKGPFSSFTDILTVEGLGVKMMEKFCDSILTKPVDSGTAPKQVAHRKIKGNLLEPVLSSDKIKGIKSATSIYINYNIIGWVRIEKDNYEVTDWQLFETDSENNNKKLKLNNIIEIVWAIHNALPKSDLYIMEAEPTMLRSVGADTNNPKMVHINLQKAQLVAMLSAYINAIGNLENRVPDGNSSTPNDDTLRFQHKVLYMRSTLSSRLFRTLVGNEKVSAQAAVEKFMNKNGEQNDNSVLIPEHIRKDYFSNDDVEKELLSQTMLIGLAFFDVCVFQKPESLKRIMNYND